MNQILGNINNKQPDESNIKIKKLKFIFYFSILIIIFCIIFYFFMKYNLFQKEKISKSLVDNFTITTLYSNNNEYIAEKSSITLEKNNEPFVIGLLKIDKINLTYPIISTSTEELLKISPCRFYGPMPNEIGNMCIAGHNYVDNKLFSKLHLLDLDDNIEIYDLSGKKIVYNIYDKMEVNIDDISCLNQETNGFCEITLVTCNNVKGTRVVIKAKENR